MHKNNEFNDMNQTSFIHNRNNKNNNENETISDDFDEDFDNAVRYSALNIVDLAGSERAKKTHASGKLLKEGCHINKSLLTLGIVINKLSEGNVQHIPYRDSKLTHILEPALGGNSKTVIICTITPADIHSEESVATLCFASRAKTICNKACINEIIDNQTKIRRMEKQIIQLKMELQKAHQLQSSNSEHISNMEETHQKYEKKIQFKNVGILPNNQLLEERDNENQQKQVLSNIGKKEEEQQQEILWIIN